MANDVLFLRTDDTWDTVEVTNHGDAIPARAIQLDYRSFSRDAGVEDGGELVDKIAYVADGCDPDELNAPLDIAPIFPGRITFQTYHKGYSNHLIVENLTHRFADEDELDNREFAKNTRFFRVIDGIEQDITDTIMEAHIIIDSPADQMEGFFRYATRVGMFGNVKEANEERFL